MPDALSSAPWAAATSTKRGPLPDELLAPLNRYFESTATSLHYTVHGKSLISSYRTFAYSLPMALWLLRLLTPDREPKVDDIVSIISALDRGQGATTISVVADLLGEMGALESIVAWYAR